MFKFEDMLIMAKKISPFLLFALTVIGVSLFLFLPGYRSNGRGVCKFPYVLSIGSTIDKTVTLLREKKIPFSKERADELRNGLMTGSTLTIPALAAFGITHSESGVTDSLLGSEQTCLTTYWFNDDGELIGLSQFSRVTWL